MHFKTIPESRGDLLISLYLFSLAFVVRFLLISKGPFHNDALELAINAQKTLDTLSMHYMHAVGYPFTVFVASIFVFLMRIVRIYDPVFSVNFMSVVFGSLCISIFYLVSRKILDISGALISSLVFCFLPLHVSISTFGMTHNLSIFFHLLGIYFLFLYFENYKLNILLLSAIFLGLGATARLMDGLIYIAAVFLYLTWSFKNSKIFKKYIAYRLMLFLGLYSITILTFYLPMILKTSFSQLKDRLYLYYYYHSLEYLNLSLVYIVEILNLAGVVIFIAGLGYFFMEKNKVIFSFLLIWFIALFIYYGTASCVDHRSFLLALIPGLIMQGYFIAKFQHKPFLFFLIFIIIVVNFFKFYPVILLRHKYNLQKDFAEFIQRNTKPSSYIIAIDEGNFIDYYTDDRTILYRAVGLNKKDFDDFFKQVDKLLEKDSDIYIVGSCVFAYDPKDYFNKRLFDDYYIKYVGGCLFEDWNFNSIRQHLFRESLYRIEKIE